VVILPDGITKAMFGYAGCNGFDYHSIRKELVADQKIEKDKISLRR